MADSKIYEVDLTYPMQGVDDTRALTRIQQQTAYDAQNVRSFEAETGRARGSRRPGLSRFFQTPATATNSTMGDSQSFPIQDINYLISTELPPPPTVVLQFAYAQASGSGFGIANASSGSSTFSGLGAVSGYRLANSCWDSNGNLYVCEVNTTTGATLLYKVTNGIVQWTQTGLTVATGTNRNVPGMCICGDYLFVAMNKVAPPYSFPTSTVFCAIARIAPLNGQIVDPLWRTTNTGLSLFFSTSAVNCLGAIGTTLIAECYFTSTGFILTFDSTKTGVSTYTAAGLYSNFGSTTPNFSKSKVVTDGTTFFYVIGCSTTYQLKKFNLALQQQWASTALDSANSICYDRTNNLLLGTSSSTTGIRKINPDTGAVVSTAAAGSVTWDEIDSNDQNVVVAWKNGVASNDVISINPTTMGTIWGPSTLANATHTGSSLSRSSATVTPSGSGARAIRPLMVMNGEIFYFDKDGIRRLTRGRSLNTSVKQIFSAQNGLNMYYVDGSGYYYYKASTNTIEQWTATSGSLPLDSPVASPGRLICNWQGCIVIAGFRQQPQLWWKSKQLDPFDWTVGTTATAATNGNVSKAGLVGDYINSLVPYTDDVLVFLCDHSMWQLTGNPNAGGRIDMISDEIGGVWGKAWAKDGFGQLYFMSNLGSIFKMTPGAQPIRMSMQIDDRLHAVDLGASTVRLCYDMRYKGLHVFITPHDPNDEAIHWFWEERTNSWWPVVFANKTHNPFAICSFDGDLPADRMIFIGTQDGKILKVDADADTDDGTTIDAYVWFPPLQNRTLDELMLHELQATLSEDSEDVTWSIHRGRTVEAAVAADAAYTGTWSAGRNRVSAARCSGFALMLKLQATGKFAIEKIRAKYETLGEQRRKM